MGSRYAFNRPIRAVERYGACKIEFTFSPSNTKFSFPDSETALIKGRVTLRFNTTPPRDTTIEVLDQARGPILEHMRNLRLTLECMVLRQILQLVNLSDCTKLARRWQSCRHQSYGNDMHQALSVSGAKGLTASCTSRCEIALKHHFMMGWKALKCTCV